MVLRFIFFIIIAILTFPLLEKELDIFKESDLKGAFEKSEAPKLTVKGWFSNRLQDEAEAYLKEKIGFKSALTKFNNQIDYSLYEKIHASDVFVGEEEYLFRPSEMFSLNNQDFIGEHQLSKFCNAYLQIHDSLANINKPLIYIFAPSKSEYFQEYIPSRFIKPNVTENKNYLYLKTFFDKHQIHYIDFISIFRELKAKYNNQPPLYSKGGIHWTQYGAAIALDTINQYLNTQFNFPKNDYQISGSKNAEQIWEQDIDIELALNLMFKRKELDVQYPIIKQTSEQRLKSIFISDSYYFALSWSGLDKYVFDEKETQYWYYLNSVRKQNSSYALADIDVPTEISKSDVLFIMATSANYARHPFDFVDLLRQSHSISIKEEEIIAFYPFLIESKTNYIKGQEEWMSKIENKATAQKISVEEMLRIDAIWSVKTEIETSDISIKIHQKIKDIYDTKEWLEQVKQKSIDNNTTLEKQVYLDAKWTIEQIENTNS